MSGEGTKQGDDDCKHGRAAPLSYPAPSPSPRMRCFPSITSVLVRRSLRGVLNPRLASGRLNCASSSRSRHWPAPHSFCAASMTQISYSISTRTGVSRFATPSRGSVLPLKGTISTGGESIIGRRVFRAEGFFAGFGEVRRAVSLPTGATRIARSDRHRCCDGRVPVSH